MIDFDHNATTTLHPWARQAWLEAGEKLIGNPSSSACASGKARPSHELAVMGYSPSEAGRVLRFRCGWETTEAEWANLADGRTTVSKGIIEA